MKELVLRALFGLIYVLVLLAAIFTSKFTYLIAITLLGFISLFELLNIVAKNSKVHQTIVFYLILALLIFIFSYLPFDFYIPKIIVILSIFVNLLLLKNLFKKKKESTSSKNHFFLSVFYLIAGFLFLAIIPLYDSQYSPKLIASVFILVWVNDIFAFLVGKYFGKRKLFERISPKKTQEGFLGGFVATLLSCFFLYKYIAIFDLLFWMGLALIISIFGPLGDLIQSKFKRQAQVKDSGNIIPGHGGVYDRLDSIIYSSPFLYAYLIIMHYVS